MQIITDKTNANPNIATSSRYNLGNFLPNKIRIVNPIKGKNKITSDRLIIKISDIRNYSLSLSISSTLTFENVL